MRRLSGRDILCLIYPFLLNLHSLSAQVICYRLSAPLHLPRIFPFPISLLFLFSLGHPIVVLEVPNPQFIYHVKCFQGVCIGTGWDEVEWQDVCI